MKVSINLPFLAATVSSRFTYWQKLREWSSVVLLISHAIYMIAYACAAVFVMKGCYFDLEFKGKGRVL